MALDRAHVARVLAVPPLPDALSQLTQSRSEAVPSFGAEQDSTESRARRALQTAPSPGGRRTAPPAVPPTRGHPVGVMAGCPDWVIIGSLVDL